MTATNTANMAFDSNGNMTVKSEGSKRRMFFWDYENRLTEVRDRKSRVKYIYDALGRRVQRYLVGGKENTKYTYDGLDVVLDDNSGVLTKYQNGPGIDNKLKVTAGGVSQYFLQDHLGSTIALTNSSGSVTSSANYDAFGNSITNNLATRYQYTGREYDDFTGLDYYRARWYAPNIGRFISEDPVGFVGGINFYGYVKNDPFFYKDPLGHNACVASWAADGSIAGAVIGGGVGLVGVVGGVAVVVTEPAGLYLGAAACGRGCRQFGLHWNLTFSEPSG
jgi:RHS repeat-associated protein